MSEPEQMTFNALNELTLEAKSADYHHTSIPRASVVKVCLRLKSLFEKVQYD